MITSSAVCWMLDFGLPHCSYLLMVAIASSFNCCECLRLVGLVVVFCMKKKYVNHHDVRCTVYGAILVCSG